MIKNQDFLELAKRASVSAGKLLMRKFMRIDKINYKSEHDLVTEADLLAERLIISLIKKKHPDHCFLAEESGKSGGKSDFTWVIDPLDGTCNFAYGIPLFGVSIALLKGREPVLGVINIPFFKQLFYAVKGGGSFMNGNPVKVSQRKRLNEMMLLHDSDFVLKKTEMMASLDKLIDRVFKIRMLGASSLHFVQIALGSADVWVGHSTTPWDIAAGCLLVEEARGLVTDFAGNPWTPWSRNLVVSNGKAHKQILEIIRKSV